MRRVALPLTLVALLLLSGCASTSPEPRAGPEYTRGADGRLITFEQEFLSTTLRGTLALRIQVIPQAGETCELLAEGTVVRPVGRFSVFTVAEKHDGTKIAFPYGYTAGGVGATVVGIKSSSLTDPPGKDSFRFTTKFNTTRVHVLTVYFEDLDATKGPLRLRLRCPTEPAELELSGGRQARILEQARSSVVYLEAEACPDVTGGAGGTVGIHLDAPMRFWLTSTAAVGFLELVGPNGSRSWDFQTERRAETADGPRGDYRVNLHRASFDDGASFDHFAAGIGAFPALQALEDLHEPNPPRAARAADATCAQF